MVRKWCYCSSSNSYVNCKLAKVLQKTAHLFMASHEGEAYFALGTPKEDALGKPRANFPQHGTQFGQAKAGRKLLSSQCPDEEINAPFDLELLGGMEPV